MFGPTELAFRVPGMAYAEFAPGQAISSMRGVSSADDGPSMDNSVVMFLDGMYVGSIASISQEMFDVERIEVLRGPQVTLFGRNAVGGVIKVTTLKPSQETNIRAEVSAGNEGTLRYQGLVSGGLTENLSAKLVCLQAQVFLDDVGGDQYFRFAATNYSNNPLGASLGTSVAIRALVHWLDIAESGGAPPYDLLNGAALEDVLVLSFREAVAELTTDQGADPLKWQLKAAPMVWRSVNFRGVPQADPANTVSLPGYQNRGSDNNVFVATGTGIEGRDVIPPGQGGHWMASGEPSPHRSDQFKLYADFAYKPLPFHREAVAAAAKTVRELRVIHPR